MPSRFQRSRAKGWRMPANGRCITRPGIFGNPFTVAKAREAGYLGSDEELAAFVVATFRRWLVNASDANWMGREADQRRSRILAEIGDLRGKDLFCFCPVGSPCHGDVLIELANA